MRQPVRQPVRNIQRTILLIAIVALAACGQAATPAPATPSPAPPDKAAPTATTARAVPTAGAGSVAPRAEPETPTAEPARAATAPTPVPPASAAAPIFGPAWGEREIYRSGLIQAERETLARLQGASEYRLALEIDESMTQVTGRQQVRYTNREDEPLDEIYMRLFPNALGGEMSVADVTGDGANVLWEYQFEGTALRVLLPEALKPGESAVIGLNYTITVPEELGAGYGLLGYTSGVLALDTPYAAIPVYNEEGWNVETPPANADTSFNDASLYLAQITAPAGVTVVATGVAVEETGVAPGATIYALGPARDFYLAASRDYTKATQQAGETRINSYALTGDEVRRDAALDAAAAALESYSERFGAYPYTEFDVAATPMLALGIEYPGTVGISTRVYDESEASLGPLLESTVAHEAAHQWFYNLVGSDQIDEPWLDEALAQYATWLYFVDQYGEARAEAWRESWGTRWERAEREQKPVGLPAREYEQQEYGAIVYGRGPLFLATLAEQMGQAQFHAFLGDYARTFRWEIATAEEFKRMAGEACKCQLDALYAEWLEPAE